LDVEAEIEFVEFIDVRGRLRDFSAGGQDASSAHDECQDGLRFCAIFFLLVFLESFPFDGIVIECLEEVLYLIDFVFAG
jgi:hypothetical protein